MCGCVLDMSRALTVRVTESARVSETDDCSLCGNTPLSHSLSHSLNLPHLPCFNRVNNDTQTVTQAHTHLPVMEAPPLHTQLAHQLKVGVHRLEGSLQDDDNKHTHSL